MSYLGSQGGGCCSSGGGAGGRDFGAISKQLGYTAEQLAIGAEGAGSNLGLGCGSPLAFAGPSGHTLLHF